MNVIVLTGAGISAEAGIPTFRDADGLWEGHRFEDVATPEAFARDPAGVHRFYNERRRALQAPEIAPTAAHHALAEFERRHRQEGRGDFLLITQNIDDLHRRAGSRRVIAMHGELLKARCADTGELFDWHDDLDPHTPHPADASLRGRLRPHVVWFGEMPWGLSEIESAARRADVFLAIGTSGVVYPAAGIVDTTPPDCRRIEINPEDTPASPYFHEVWREKASTAVPRVLASLETTES